MKIIKLLVLFCIGFLASKIKYPRSKLQKTTNYLNCKLIYFDYKEPIASRSAGERSIINTLQYLNCIITVALETSNDEPVKFIEYLRAFKKIYKLRKLFQHEQYLLVKSPEIFWICSLLLFGTNVKFVYYSTDIFYLRLQSEKNIDGLDFTKKFRMWMYEKLEPKIWSAAVTVFSNRDDEGVIIRKFCNDVRLIPTRVVEYKDGHNFNVSNAINIVFVGGAGNEPNIASLEYFIDEVCEPLCLDGMDIELRVCGGGWSKLHHSFLNKSYINLVGRVSDAELEELYASSDFAAGYMKFGAGIKGKVIEAMEFGVPVICNSIGSEGLPDDILKPMEAYTDVKNFIKMCKSDFSFYNTLKNSYFDFLSSQYSHEKFLISLQGKQ